MRPGKASRGWGSQAYKNGNKDGVQWKHSQAVRIGWFDGTSLYLDEHETMNLVQTLATQQHNQISQPSPVKN